MANLSQAGPAPWYRQFPIFFNYIIVSVMMACVASTLVALLGALAPAWNGTYLVVVSFIVALETLYATRATRSVAFPSRAWLSYRGTELVTILILLKLLVYAMDGIGQLFRDLELWQKDFLVYFFSGEYLAAVLVVLIVWLLCHSFNTELMELEADDETLEKERRNEFRNDRQSFRKQLTLKIVLTGGAMVAVTVLLRAYLRAQRGEAAAAGIGVFNLLLYVVLGFVLLSQTRFSALRASWYRERAVISKEVFGQWVGYSIIFVIVMAIVVSVLPTRYSIGLLTVLGYLFGWFIVAVQFVFYFILLLLSLPLNLLMSLLGRPGVSPTPPPPAPPPLPPPAPSQPTADPLLDLIQSVLFWAIFLIVVAYSLAHYLGRHREALAVLRSLPILGWLLRGAEWLWSGLRHWNRQLATALEAGLRRLRTPPVTTEVKEQARIMSLRRLSPRERVQYFYLAMVRRGSQRGMARRPSQTPSEYASTLESAVPEVNTEIDSLTASFVEARYSRHDITTERAKQVQSYWNRIKAALRAHMWRL